MSSTTPTASTLPGDSRIKDLITESIVHLERAPWLARLRGVGLQDKRIVVVGREQVGNALRALVQKLGARVERVDPRGPDTRSALDGAAVVLDGESWERGEIPPFLLAGLREQRRPYLVLLGAGQQYQRSQWIESGALDTFPMPPPLRRLTARLVEAATGTRAPLPRRVWTVEGHLRFEGKDHRAKVLELSPEDLLITSPLALPAGKTAQMTFAATDRLTLTVACRSLFCRSYVARRSVESGRGSPHVMGLRILGVSREESDLLDRLGMPGTKLPTQVPAVTVQFE